MSDIKRKTFSDGDVSIWMDEDAAVHLKAVSPFGDPVELTAAEAKEIARYLLSLVEEADD